MDSSDDEQQWGFRDDSDTSGESFEFDYEAYGVHPLHLATNFLRGPPTTIFGRECEKEEISRFITHKIKTKSGGAMYICGIPGTGKTATVRWATEDLFGLYKFRYYAFNCASDVCAGGFYHHMWLLLNQNQKSAPPSSSQIIPALTKLITTSTEMILLVVDEVDQISKQAIKQLFTWPSDTNSKLILIGLANTLDMAERVLPHLDDPPKTVHFGSYNKQQIIEIINGRLAPLKAPIFEPKALMLMATKLADFGDLRKALDIAIEIIRCHEAQTKEIANSNQRLIGMQAVAAVLKNTLGSHYTEQINNLPPNQKIILVGMMLALKNGTSGTINSAYRKCQALCHEQHLTSLHQSDFLEACELLSTTDLVSITGATKAKIRNFKLQMTSQFDLKITADDLKLAFQEDPFMAQLL